MGKVKELQNELKNKINACKELDLINAEQEIVPCDKCGEPTRFYGIYTDEEFNNLTWTRLNIDGTFHSQVCYEKLNYKPKFKIGDTAIIKSPINSKIEVILIKGIKCGKYEIENLNNFKRKYKNLPVKQVDLCGKKSNKDTAKALYE